MTPTFTASARRIGVVSAVGCVLLTSAYAATLVAGLRSLRTPQDPIGDPYFAVLEILIIVLAPLMVAMMGAVHAWAPPEAKAGTRLALVFAGLLAVVTCGVHVVVLAVGRQAASFGVAGMPLLFAFRWPSVVYALEVLAWDVFYALSVLFAAPAFATRGLGLWIRWLLAASGVMALAGLSGVAAGDMRLRYVGIVGYVGVFPVAAALVAALFHRATPRGR